VFEAAVIAVDHPTWQEKSLLIVHCKPDAIPDDVVFVDSLPHTATGKLLKTALRQPYRNHLTAG
jgi:fatty-acyl-CoA synthase